MHQHRFGRVAPARIVVHFLPPPPARLCTALTSMPTPPRGSERATDQIATGEPRRGAEIARQQVEWGDIAWSGVGAPFRRLLPAHSCSALASMPAPPTGSDRAVDHASTGERATHEEPARRMRHNHHHTLTHMHPITLTLSHTFLLCRTHTRSLSHSMLTHPDTHNHTQSYTNTHTHT